MTIEAPAATDSVAEPETVAAAVLRAYGSLICVAEVPTPLPEDGALVVDMIAATVCGSDTHLAAGHYADSLDIRLPVIPGHEGVGRISTFGAGAEVDSVGQPLVVGDRVIFGPAPCRHCHTCTIKKRPALCPNRRMGMQSNCEEFPFLGGTFAQRTYVPALAGRIRVPDSVSDISASIASCALRSAVNTVRAADAVLPTDHAVVQGAGPLGLCLTVLLARMGPRTLTVIGGPADRLELARLYGATDVVSVIGTDTATRLDEVRTITSGDGADLTFDCSGFPGVIEEGVELTGLGGHYVIAGTLGGPPEPVSVGRIATKGLRLSGVFSSDIDAYWTALQVMADPAVEVDWDAMAGPTYDLASLDQAMSDMAAGRCIKPIIDTRKGR